MSQHFLLTTFWITGTLSEICGRAGVKTEIGIVVVIGLMIWLNWLRLRSEEEID